MNTFKTMTRKSFLIHSTLGVAVLPTLLSCQNSSSTNQDGECLESPDETAGPFPIKDPASLIRREIYIDREGLILNMELSIQNHLCEPMEDVYVDVWHCDAQGAYSEYGGNNMQSENYTNEHFLRGRQLTDLNGNVAFVSIFPGWYSGRAPHIHIEVLDKQGNSLKVSQIAFPKDICDQVYALNNYEGTADTTNERDNIFSDSLDQNMTDSLEGNTNDGYILKKTIIVTT